MCMYAYIYIYISKCVYIYVICVYACMYVCMSVCAYVCMYVCTFKYTHIYTYIISYRVYACTHAGLPRRFLPIYRMLLVLNSSREQEMETTASAMMVSVATETPTMVEVPADYGLLSCRSIVQGLSCNPETLNRLHLLAATPMVEACIFAESRSEYFGRKSCRHYSPNSN